MPKYRVTIRFRSATLGVDAKDVHAAIDRADLLMKDMTYVERSGYTIDIMRGRYADDSIADEGPRK